MLPTIGKVEDMRGVLNRFQETFLEVVFTKLGLILKKYIHFDKNKSWAQTYLT